MKLQFSRQIFENCSHIKFYENPFSGSRVFTCGWTERQDETKSRVSKFCERA